jgi:hypothetical protein
MAMAGETILSVDEQTAFAELTANYGDPRDAVALGGLSAVMARVQQEATVQSEQLAAGQSDLNAEAAAFKSAV